MGTLFSIYIRSFFSGVIGLFLIAGLHCSWAGSMNEKRSDHGATLLADGRVLITGGSQNIKSIFGTEPTSSKSSAEIYDPDFLISVKTGSMRIARHNHESILLKNGKVLIVGGFHWTSGLSSQVWEEDENTAELYDPSTGSFEQTGSPVEILSFSPSTMLRDGRVLFLGSVETVTWSTTGNLQIYDPVTGKFSLAGTHPDAQKGWRLVTLLDGKVLVLGGYDSLDNPLTTAWLYDPVTETFAQTGSLNYARAYASLTLLDSGKVLVFGGGECRMELYDPATGLFSLKERASGNCMGRATRFNDGRIFILGSKPQFYHPDSGTFSQAAPFPVDYWGYALTFLKDNRFLISGGYIPAEQSHLNTLEFYVP